MTSPDSVHTPTLTELDHLRQTVNARIDKGSLALPLLPQVASLVIALTNDPKSDAAKLSNLIHQDQALAGHVLRIANSPAYLPRTPIVSLQQAIAWLGMNLLKEIALTASLQSGVFKVRGFDTEVKHLWQHALASAVYGKEVARVRRHNVESAFLCGLLHAIGKPVVLKVVADVQDTQNLKLEWADIAEILEDHHVRVGSLVAGKWGLPKPVQVAISYYRDHQKAPSGFPETMVTCLADRLATHLLVPGKFTDESVQDHPVIADLNLYPEDMKVLLGKGDTVLATVVSMAI